MPHTEIIADVAIPLGTYKEGDRTKKRHRTVGVLLETQFEDGSRSMSMRLHFEILNDRIAALMQANKIHTMGDDSVMCPIYRRDRKKAAADEPAAAIPPGGAADEHGPF